MSIATGQCTREVAKLLTVLALLGETVKRLLGAFDSVSDVSSTAMSRIR